MASFCPKDEPICVVRGDSPIVPIKITDSAGVIIDITGYSFVLTVDPSPVPANDTNNLFQVAISALVDGTSGIVQVPLSSANTDQTPNFYFYDFQVVTTALSKRTLLSGTFEIKQDITKV